MSAEKKMGAGEAESGLGDRSQCFHLSNVPVAKLRVDTSVYASKAVCSLRNISWSSLKALKVFVYLPMSLIETIHHTWIYKI